MIGHSFGGLVAQVLADRGLGAATVAVASAPVKGVLRLPISTLRASYPVLHSPVNRHRGVQISPDEFRYAFGNTLQPDDSDRAWRRYAVPAAGHVLFEGAFANLDPHSAATVDTGRNDRPPLLLIAGGEDHVSPPSLVKANAGLYQKSRAVTAYHEFPGRSHFTVGEPGWEADRRLRPGLGGADDAGPGDGGRRPPPLSRAAPGRHGRVGSARRPACPSTTSPGARHRMPAHRHPRRREHSPSWSGRSRQRRPR